MDVDQHQQILLQVKCKSVQSALPGHVVSPFNSHGPSEHNTLVNAHKSISGHTFDTPVSLVFALWRLYCPAFGVETLQTRDQSTFHICNLQQS